MASTQPHKYSSDRRERMKELQAEGKMTPEHGRLGGRPKKAPTDSHPRPAAAAVAAAARENADAVAQVFIDVLEDEKSSNAEKVRAMKNLIGIEQREAGLELEERRQDPHPDRPKIETREDALASLAKSLSDPIVRDRFLARFSTPTPAGPPTP